MSLRFKFFLWTAAPVGIVLLLVLGFGLNLLSERIERKVVDDLHRSAVRYSLVFSHRVLQVAKVADQAAAILGHRETIDENFVRTLLYLNLRGDPLIQGSIIRFEAEGLIDLPGSGLHAYRPVDGGGGVEVVDLGYSDRDWEWWNLPRVFGAPSWSEPFRNALFGNEQLATYSVPIWREGIFYGVVAVDISLDALSAELAADLGELDNFMVLSSAARFVLNTYSPALEGTLPSAQEIFQEQDRPDLVAAFRQIVRTGEGQLTVDGFGADEAQRQWLFYVSMPSVDWFFVSGLGEGNALRPVRDAAVAGGAAVVLLLVLTAMVTWQTSGVVTRRLARVQGTAARIAEGELDARTGVAGRDEVGRLAAAVDEMAGRIAAREREIIEINRGLEDTVRQRTQELHLALDNMADGLFVIDPDMRFSLFNDHYRQMMGLDESVLNVGTQAIDVARYVARRGAYGDADPDELARRRVAALANDEVIVSEARSVAGRILETRKTPLAAGGCVGLVTDITEKKTAEQERERQRMLLDQVLNNIAQGVIKFDRDKRIAIWNERFRHMLELPPEMMQPGRPARDLSELMARRGDYGEGEPEALLEARRRQVWGGQADRQEISVADRDYDVSSQPTDDGGTVVTYTDITERKKAEDEIRDAYRVISESVDYASQIQRSMLPAPSALQAFFADHFVIWEPRDVVGGDFYWFEKVAGGRLLIVCDCTGHGVPGAFMTIVGNGALNRALDAHPDGDPAAVLSAMHRHVQRSLLQDTEEGYADDGMELGICRIDDDGRMRFAGARFSLLAASGEAVREIKGDRMGIGYRRVDAATRFANREVALEAGTTYYMTTDGAIDQVGGEKHRAFGRKRLSRLLQSLMGRPLEEQKQRLLEAFADWRGSEARRDDVTVIGFRLSA